MGSVDGFVTIYFSNGSKFKGVFQNGKKHGDAVEIDADGKRFEGSYKYDKRNGKFTERDKDGKIIARGYYEDGIRSNN